MSGFKTWEMGDGDEHVGKKSQRFKAEGGRKYRISCAWWPTGDGGKPDLSKNPNFIGADISYIEGVGYVVNKGPEYTKLAGKPPTLRVATIIIVWPLGSDGKLDKKRIRDGSVHPWVFSGEKYDNLKSIHGEFPLGEHDVTLSCTDTQYQKMSFSPCRDNVLKAILGNPKASELAGKLMEQVKALAENLRDEVGREMTVEQVRERLAGGGGSAAAASASPVADADIDDMVDGMLDLDDED